MKCTIKFGFIIVLFIFFSSIVVLKASHAAEPTILAAYQAWFGLPSHLPVYNSCDPDLLAQQIQKAKDMGIDGFVVDWYGPQAGVINDTDREFIDQATAVLIEQAEADNFKIALMYDEGAVAQAGLDDERSMGQVQADLVYAKKYFSSPAYLHIHGYPALFVFSYDEVDQYLDWETLRSELGTQLTLIDNDPNPAAQERDDIFDGFYAWVQADWRPKGKDWGKGYLDWFYGQMKEGRYADKIMIGGVWPGFDDLLAFWGKRRFIPRQNGQVYAKTMDLAQQHDAAIILLETWNDFEEGTDIEFGRDMIVDMEADYPDLLVRSSPITVEWDPARGELAVQVYKNGRLIYDQRKSSGVSLALKPKGEYELKLWTSGTDTLSQWIKIRRKDLEKRRNRTRG
ncbi:MAG: endo-1,3-alpha-glucanase family glycosylhydrolase [Candidatus Electrothrix sp. GW3-4]|uniref:endo-1,3-alpha-glucanase family glycosylhydrolase n=1 Tax=Candidatus Electrothrix sp. GW3-4 TaxID=3126740 RepID=UPI0030CC740B